MVWLVGGGSLRNWKLAGINYQQFVKYFYMPLLLLKCEIGIVNSSFLRNQFHYTPPPPPPTHTHTHHTVSNAERFTRLRNGENTNTQNYQSGREQETFAQYQSRRNNVQANRGMHETFEYYDDCYTRTRNLGELRLHHLANTIV